MDWKILFVTFGTVFLAELGDKTQLATLLYATEGKNPWLVFFGAAAALTLSSFIAVMVGGSASKYIPIRVLHTVAGIGFVLVGVWVLTGVVRHGKAGI